MKEYGFSFESIVANANDIVIVTKADRISEPGPEIIFVNEAFSTLTGYSRDEAIGRSPRFLQGEETDPNSMRLIGEALAEKRPVRTIIKNYSKYGESYWLDINIVPLKDSGGWTTHFAAIERDVTQEVERERLLSERASTDFLTGAYNRRTFLDRAVHEISRSKRYGEQLSLAILDLDHFKTINDTYGHSAGDAVLQRVTEMSNSILRASDVFARIGGEEFAVLMPSTPPDAACATMERLRRDLAASSTHWDGLSIQASVSIGLATYLPQDDTIEPIMQRADAALYIAKKNGRNRVVPAEVVVTDAGKSATPELAT